MEQDTEHDGTDNSANPKRNYESIRVMVQKTDKKDRLVQLRFSGPEIERLDDLQEKTFASTRAEVIRSALRLYEFITEQRDAGYSVQLQKGGKTKTIVAA